jgi:hypothetical protein
LLIACNSAVLWNAKKERPPFCPTCNGQTAVVLVYVAHKFTQSFYDFSSTTSTPNLGKFLIRASLHRLSSAYCTVALYCRIRNSEVKIRSASEFRVQSSKAAKWKRSVG